MTEEEKQAIRDAYAMTIQQARPNANSFVELVEAQLSPKHPKKGAICETWDDKYGHEIHVSTGDGEFGPWADGRDSDTIKQDHYREIPTCESAIPVLIKEGMSGAVTILRKLIDDALEG